MTTTAKNINQYKSLFKGRSDIYAVRWTKEGRSIYIPACKVDWTDYNKHKAQGGSFKDYKNKEYLPFDNKAIETHLSGKETCGIYPLLEDNTSFFIAVDFDKQNWKEAILNLHKTCSNFNIPSCIERSRSGNGGHLWVFFEDAFPAEQSRKIMFELLRHASIISHFEKEPSFDRLFPNQDFHSGKGMGNLIALPLQGKSVEKGNSCFINPETFEVYPDQWEYLASVKKISIQELKEFYELFFNEKPQEIFVSSSPNEKNNYQLEIVISNQTYLKRAQLNQKLIRFLREQLNFYNSDYLTKRNLGKSVFNTEKFFKLIEETANRFKTILVLSERKAHVDTLNLYLKDKYETITIHGEDSESSRKSKIEQIKQGHFKVVISTGQYFGEGIDISNLECLFIVYPFAFEGKLIQYIGRIQRSENPPVIFDYRDVKIDYFEKMFKQRNRYYKKLLK